MVYLNPHLLRSIPISDDLWKPTKGLPHRLTVVEAHTMKSLKIKSSRAKTGHLVPERSNIFITQKENIMSHQAFNTLASRLKHNDKLNWEKNRKLLELCTSVGFKDFLFWRKNLGIFFILLTIWKSYIMLPFS